MLFQSSSFEATFLKSQRFIISKILSVVFINTVSAHLRWLWNILMISWESRTNLFPGFSTEPTRRLLIWSFAIFSKPLHNISVDLSIAAAPVIVSLSKSQKKDQDVRPITDISYMQWLARIDKTEYYFTTIILIEKRSYHETNLSCTKRNRQAATLLTPLVTLSNNWRPCEKICINIFPTFTHVQKWWYSGFVYWLQKGWGIGIGRLLVQTLLDSRSVLGGNKFTNISTDTLGN